MLSAYTTPAHLFGAFVAVSAVVALRNWRLGILLGFVVGIVQDPIRKLTPDTPGVMAVSSVPVWAAVILAGFVAKRGSWRRFRGAFPQVAGWVLLLVLSLLPATIVLLRHGPGVWRLAAIGIHGYLNPLGALLVGVFLLRNLVDFQRLVRLYLLVTIAFMSGVFIEYLQLYPSWPALGTWALGANWDRYAPGVNIGLMSGFYRAPDLMSWHAATAVILALTMALHRGGRRGLVYLVPAAIAALCLVLGGRRKMIAMPAIWLAVMSLNLGRQGRIGRLVGLSAAAVVALAAVLLAAGEIGVAGDYYTYVGSTGEDAPHRILRIVKATWRTYEESGLLGEGIGAATMGSRYLGLPIRTWQETGLAKIMVELGVLGVVCAIGLTTRVALTLTRQLRRQHGHPAPLIHMGLTGLGAANLASFLISHQAYGDAVVMFGTGLGLGLALSGAHWRHRFAAAGGAGTGVGRPLRVA